MFLSLVQFNKKKPQLKLCCCQEKTYKTASLECNKSNSLLLALRVVVIHDADFTVVECDDYLC